jgi:RNA polymerase sigma factor (sigma-70 family)
LDKNLIDLVRAGSREGYSQLYTVLYNKIFMSRRYSELEQTDKNDIFQEAVENIEAWFAGACKNIFLNKIRRDRQHQTLTESLRHEEEEDEVSSEELTIRVFRIMNASLDEKCKELLKYFFVNGLDAEEIAERMDYTRSFVRNKKSRCIKRLKSLIKSDFYDF